MKEKINMSADETTIGAERSVRNNVLEADTTTIHCSLFTTVHF